MSALAAPDTGETVGENLGKIDAVLLIHVHQDHLGSAHQATANTGICGKPDFSVRGTRVAAKQQEAGFNSPMHEFRRRQDNETKERGDAGQVGRGEPACIVSAGPQPRLKPD